MTKCLGCGSVLQNTNSLKEGYVKDLNNKFCERCFKITHYNNYIYSYKDNSEYLKKINEIGKTNDLVILTMDFLNMFDIDSLNINNPIILVFTKKDLLPRSINENKFLEKIRCNLNIKDKLFISSNNNYNLDLLMNKIMKYKVSDKVYVIGLTNDGKSTLINKILKNYSDNESNITTSDFPSTTLDFIEKNVSDDLILVDTPGLLDDGSIVMCSSKDELKKIIPKKEIKPIVYQVKVNQSIIVDDFMRVDIRPFNDIIIYMSNNLKISRLYKDNNKLNKLKIYDVKLDDNQDLVIKGLGFIKFKFGCNIKIYLDDRVSYYIRDSIV